MRRIEEYVVFCPHCGEDMVITIWRDDATDEVYEEESCETCGSSQCLEAPTPLSRLRSLRRRSEVLDERA